MFGIGLPELILIMVVALIVVGPDKLPDLAKTLARQIVELKRAANSLKDSLNEDDDLKPWEKNPLELGQIERTPPNRDKAGPDNWVQDETSDQEKNSDKDESGLEGNAAPSSAENPEPLVDESTADINADAPHVDDNSDIKETEETPATAEEPEPEPTAENKPHDDEENKIKAVKADKIDE
jgi:Tat protein translocase TatB subunit